MNSFVMKETDETPQDEYYEQDSQWETFNETTNQQYSDESANDTTTTQQTNGKVKIRKFSDHIRIQLERSFLANNFITGDEKKVLANRLKLTERQVSKWFVHRREKLRRLEKRATNINSTLQQHYNNRTKQSSASQPTQFVQPNNEFNENNAQEFGEEYYENDDEENWFNELQNDGEQLDIDQNTQFITHNESEYYDDYNEITNGFHSSNNSETNHSDDNIYNSNNKRYSTDLNGSLAKRVCIQSEMDGDKPQRRLFPPQVITHLETIFDNDKYLKEDQVADLCLSTNLSQKQIRSWFKQRRYRYNQENKQNGIDIEIKKYNNLSQNVVNELEKSFNKNNYVYGNDKKALARELNLTPVQLERWFYYRRKKQSNGTASLANETF